MANTLLERVTLRSNELERAIQFYRDCLGLAVEHQTSDAVYLACGYGESYDLEIRHGGTGIERCAIRTSSGELDAIRKSCDAEGADYREFDSDVPSEATGIRVTLPSGLTIELVTVDSPSYQRVAEPSNPERAPGGPHELDHLNIMSTDVKTDARFLEDVIGFDISDVAVAGDGHWWAAWTRFGSYHHDIAIHEAPNDDMTLHHVAFHAADISQMKSLIDAVKAAGVQLEVGIGRHRVGDNLFAYFWSPGGNRVELSVEMARLDEDLAICENGPGDETFSAWGANTPPETFREGS